MKTIGLIFGGTSSEHRISLWTGRFIFETLNNLNLKVIPILYTRNGKWVYANHPVNHMPGNNESTPDELENLFMNHFTPPMDSFPFNLKFDVCFLGLHGGSGENGVIQGFLDLQKIPYTGSGVLASALAMDKYISYQLFEKHNFNVSPFFEISKNDYIVNRNILKEKLIDFPYFLKPTCGGSSVSTGMVKNIGEADELIKKIFIKEERALFQKPIRGVEVSCGVLEKSTSSGIICRALNPTEIVPDGDFFDESAKYQGKSKEITPARISNELRITIQELSIKAHKILGCSGYSRTDFIIENNIPFILETNTLPGMTPNSLIPQQVRYEGEDMKDVLLNLIEIAEKRNQAM